jgi:hypothetical protein
VGKRETIISVKQGKLFATVECRLTLYPFCWATSSTSLGLGKNSTASLQAFKKRSDDARRVLNSLKEQKTDIDFAFYKSTLKNQSVVDSVEKSLKDFKPVTYDVSAQLKAIDAFEAKAVSVLFALSSEIVGHSLTFSSYPLRWSKLKLRLTRSSLRSRP